MSGTHHLFTATGRALPPPPSRTPKRTSSVVRLPTRRYDPVLDGRPAAAAPSPAGERHRSYENPHGGDFVYRSERERRASQLVPYGAGARYGKHNTKDYGALSATARGRRGSRFSAATADDSDSMAGATEMSSGGTRSLAGSHHRRHRGHHHQRRSPSPRATTDSASGSSSSSSSRDDSPSIDVHLLGHARRDRSRSSKRNRNKSNQRPREAGGGWGTGDDEPRRRLVQPQPHPHYDTPRSVRSGAAAGSAHTPATTSTSETGGVVGRQGQQQQWGGDRTPCTPSAASMAALETRRRPAAKQQQQQQQRPFDLRLDGSSNYSSSQASRSLDPNKPLPHHNRSVHRQPPSPHNYQPFTHNQQQRQQWVAPTPRFSRSNRNDTSSGMSGLQDAAAENYETIPERVRRLSTSPERSPTAPGRRRAMSLGGTELLPPFPLLQGQSGAGDGERARHYRTIVCFIERQPEAQRRELRKLYIDEYQGSEEAFAALLSEAYGEDFEAMKMGTPLHNHQQPQQQKYVPSGAGAGPSTSGGGGHSSSDAAAPEDDEGDYEEYGEGEPRSVRVGAVEEEGEECGGAPFDEGPFIEKVATAANGSGANRDSNSRQEEQEEEEEEEEGEWEGDDDDEMQTPAVPQGL